ncbi:efflux RND transporter periplasmic adaptor subunit [Denitrobaculum tricleocarpae]|uniref:efflux RND transporter periplasmic adaptor subunit n=1 Tax=Denitrobaculum tricleocarpae TaxID=2591009 RepID=UPI0015D107BE|nr:efflux RND transporter periplasmic adaptor subunit [Denitrobaculum tricleocarpae]
MSWGIAMQFRHFAIASLVVTAVAIGSGTRERPALAQQAAEPPSVIVVPAERRDITPTFSYLGRAEAVDTVELRARVSGFLEKRNFREGTEIKAGEVLFEIERDTYEITVQQREADLTGAKATLQNAQADFSRKETLVKRGTASEASLDSARATLGTGRASVLQAEAALRAANLDLSYTEVISPIDGKISRARYSVGNFVGPNSEPLATVISLDPIYVTIAVSEKQLIEARRQGINLDNPVVAPSLQLSDGSFYEHPGEFDYLDSTVNQSTDTVTARAVFPNPERLLLPGEFVTVVVRQITPQSAVVIPQASVQKDQKGYFVLVVDRANKVEVRRVTLGDQVEMDWVVNDGLTEGEQVIVQGLQKVQPEMLVNPVTMTGGGQG